MLNIRVVSECAYQYHSQGTRCSSTLLNAHNTVLYYIENNILLSAHEICASSARLARGARADVEPEDVDGSLRRSS